MLKEEKDVENELIGEIVTIIKKLDLNKDRRTLLMIKWYILGILK
ncbi:hypothetical protein NYU56_18315 (plasmid) [Clostridioides difficile]|nr:hypothetical protein [Clostridioides difficile]UWD46806.1 hypothetical protein NYU56_18315 [Clostridioides difficile]